MVTLIRTSPWPAVSTPRAQLCSSKTSAGFSRTKVILAPDLKRGPRGARIEVGNQIFVMRSPLNQNWHYVSRSLHQTAHSGLMQCPITALAKASTFIVGSSLVENRSMSHQATSASHSSAPTANSRWPASATSSATQSWLTGKKSSPKALQESPSPGEAAPMAASVGSDSLVAGYCGPAVGPFFFIPRLFLST